MKFPKLKLSTIDLYSICTVIAVLLILFRIYLFFYMGESWLSVFFSLLPILLFLWINLLFRRKYREYEAIKDEYEDYQRVNTKLISFFTYVIHKKAIYRVIHNEKEVLVAYIYSDDDYLPIKAFPFGNDKEYATLCAEELCEMLNQKI